MVKLEPRAQPVSGEPARSVVGQAKRVRERRAKKCVSKSIEHESEGRFRNLVILVADAELSDEATNGIENGIQGITVTGEDHPCGKGTRTLAAKGIKRLVDNRPGICLAGSRSFDRFGNARGDRVRDRPGELALQACG